MHSIHTCPSVLGYILVVYIYLLSGCASVNLEKEYPRSMAFTDTQKTKLGQIANRLASNSKKESAEASGFYPLTNGIESFGLRLTLAEAAEKSIDLQYYLIKNDPAGRMFVGTLLRAADRGVRVRILLDDIFTSGYDQGMLALDSHPNIELRLFNPFANRKLRVFDAHRFAQVNRRLHNKSFTVDNQFTIIGGRNIAAEYFSARDDLNFHDLDVMSIGPLVRDVSNMFDQYWNTGLSVPVTEVADPKDTDLALRLDEMRRVFDEELSQSEENAYKTALQEDVKSIVKSLPERFNWAPYELIYDAPEKALKSESKQANNIIVPIREVASNAQQQLIIVSPYFVPLKSGINRLKELNQQGIDVTIVTNSFKSNNHTLVHAGYAPYRKRILQTGALLYEAKPNARMDDLERIRIYDSGATLHSKLFIVDKDTIFIGSFNFDPRSVNLNTEMGVVIYSDQIVARALENLPARLHSSTYEVTLNHKGKLQWVDRSSDPVSRYQIEPNTSWWDRFKLGLMRILPIRSQL